MNAPYRPRGSVRAQYDYDYERKTIIDPHYRGEIAMLERSLADTTGLSPQGIETTRTRLADLKRLAPYFDGKRMIKDSPWWPCRCAVCTADAEMKQQREAA